MANRRNGKTLETAERICEMINDHKTVAIIGVDGMNEVAPIVRCEDCGYSFCEGFVRERLYCEKHPELGEIKGDWFCADCWKA